MFDCHTKNLCLQSVLERDQGARSATQWIYLLFYVVLRLDLCFFFFFKYKFDSIFSVYYASHRAKSSSSALQQHAVLSVKRDQRLKCFFKKVPLPERIRFGGFTSFCLNVSEAFPPQQKKLYIYKYIYTHIYPGGNTGLKFLLICHLLSYEIMYE